MEQRLFDVASKLPKTGLEFDGIQVPIMTAAKPWRKVAVLAVCLILLISVSFGTYAFAAEAKAYRVAAQFFDTYGLSTEGLTRNQIKAVCQDITTKTFEYGKTAEVIGSSLTPEQKSDYEKQQNDPAFEDAENLWDFKMQNAMFAPVLDFIELTYCGNPHNTLTIDDPDLVSQLLGWVQKAKATGKQVESTRGHYGAPFHLKVYQCSEPEPLVFTIWSKTRYATPEHQDENGYPYFYEADLSEIYTFLDTHYPPDIWYLYHKTISGKGIADGEYETAISFASFAKSSELYSGALNGEKLRLSSQRHVPIYKFDTLEEFEDFKSNVYGRDEPTLNAVTANCHRSFFEKNTLLLVYLNSRNSTMLFDVESVTCNGEALCVDVKGNISHDNYIVTDEGRMGWFLLVAVSDSWIANCTEIDAK